ncbi:hypothetical protein O0L34_g2627 [Tuta absoluta]|nr:hypothetical protein O0L34_g2627 [Tuta absoluta]
MASEKDCKCLRIDGHLEAVNWMLWRDEYKPSPGVLAVADWTHDPFYWLHHVESNNGLLPQDDVLQTTNSRYWSIHDPQRYFLMDLHCEQVLFTQQYPNLRMKTRLGSHMWKENTASKVPPFFTYQKEFLLSMEITLKKMEINEDQVDRLIVSDQLINVSKFDVQKRKSFFRILENIFSSQENLQLVSLENLACLRMEGVKLIEKLATFNADTLKYLFLWGFVLPNENPILINYSYISGHLSLVLLR